MKKILLITLIFLTSCNNSIGNNNVSNGFAFPAYSDYNPWLATAVETKSKQENSIELKVSIGYNKTFIEKWFNHFVADCNTFFGIKRVIDFENDTYEHYDLLSLELKDFEDEEKYSFLVYAEKDSDDYLFRKFNFSFQDTFGISDLPDQGRIFYTFCLVDQNQNVLDKKIDCGISEGELFFTKKNETVFFK